MLRDYLTTLIDGVTKAFRVRGEVKIVNPEEDSVNVQLKGSIPEYGWVDGDAEPTPDGFAFGAKVDPATGSITPMYWNGAAWVEVV